jgi:hypothetical protein
MGRVQPTERLCRSAALHRRLPRRRVGIVLADPPPPLTTTAVLSSLLCERQFAPHESRLSVPSTRSMSVATPVVVSRTTQPPSSR